MSPLSWLITFAVIGLLSVVGLLGIGWYARRAMEEHQRQVKEILTEMQRVMEEDSEMEKDPGDEEVPGPEVDDENDPGPPPQADA